MCTQCEEFRKKMITLTSMKKNMTGRTTGREIGRYLGYGIAQMTDQSPMIIQNRFLRIQ